MGLKQIALPIAALALGTSVAAAVTLYESKKKAITSWTCAEFLALEDQFQPKIVYAASSFAKGGKPPTGVIDIDGTEKVTPMVIEDCRNSPRSSFIRMLKDGWAKVDADAKAEIKKIDKKL